MFIELKYYILVSIGSKSQSVMLNTDSAMLKLKLLVLCGVLCCVFPLVCGTGDIGPGVWQVNYITKCEAEEHKVKFDINQKKLNRTHACFNAVLKLEEPLTDDFGVHIDICKYVDGGCKQYQVLTDDCFVNFVNKYAENNVKKCLEIAGVDPPEFPVAEGEYHITNFVMDYSELPVDAIYGVFYAKALMLKGTEEVACLGMHVEFKEAEEEDDDDCDDE